MDFRKSQNISVDIVLMGFDGQQISVLLEKRYLNLYSAQVPIIDDWKLTGHHIFKDERLDEAATRIINEYGQDPTVYLHQFRAFGNPKRLQKKKDVIWLQSKQNDAQTLSVGYYGLTDLTQFTLKDTSCQWFPLDDLPEIGLDHDFIIKEAYKYVKEKIYLAPIIYNFLPIKFTLNHLQSIYEAIFKTKMDNRNFRKKLSNKPYIVQLDEKERLEGAKKPANLYMFSQDIYNRMREEKPLFII